MTIQGARAFVGRALGVCLLSFAANLASASEPVAVGSAAPDFAALTVDSEKVSLASYKDAKVLVVCFTCNGCPVAQAYEQRFIDFAKAYKDKGVRFVAINCNSNEALDAIRQRIADAGISYDYVSDASGEAAKAYGATVTPQLFVLDGERKVAFTGPFDDDMSKPGVSYVSDAVDAVLEGKQPSVTSARPFGCRIKLAR